MAHQFFFGLDEMAIDPDAVLNAFEASTRDISTSSRFDRGRSQFHVCCEFADRIRVRSALIKAAKTIIKEIQIQQQHKPFHLDLHLPLSQGDSPEEHAMDRIFKLADARANAYDSRMFLNREPLIMHQMVKKIWHPDNENAQATICIPKLVVSEIANATNSRIDIGSKTLTIHADSEHEASIAGSKLELLQKAYTKRESLIFDFFDDEQLVGYQFRLRKPLYVVDDDLATQISSTTLLLELILVQWDPEARQYTADLKPPQHIEAHSRTSNFWPNVFSFQLNNETKEQVMEKAKAKEHCDRSVLTGSTGIPITQRDYETTRGPGDPLHHDPSAPGIQTKGINKIIHRTKRIPKGFIPPGHLEHVPHMRDMSRQPGTCPPTSIPSVQLQATSGEHMANPDSLATILPFRVQSRPKSKNPKPETQGSLSHDSILESFQVSVNRDQQHSLEEHGRSFEEKGMSSQAKLIPFDLLEQENQSDSDKDTPVEVLLAENEQSTRNLEHYTSLLAPILKKNKTQIDHSKRILAALTQIIEVASSCYKSSIILEVLIGKIFVNSDSIPEEIRYVKGRPSHPFPPSYWSRVFRTDKNHGNASTFFSPKISRSWVDAEYIIELLNGDKPFFKQSATTNQNMHTPVNWLELILRNETTSESFMIKACSTADIQLSGSWTRIGSINLHFPNQTWDTCFLVKAARCLASQDMVGFKTMIESIHTCGPADLDTIAARAQNTPFVTLNTGSRDIVVDRIELKREVMHDTNPDIIGGFKMSLTQVQKLSVVRSGNDKYIGWLDDRSASGSLRSWWEMRMFSDEINQVFERENPKLGIGEKAAYSSHELNHKLIKQLTNFVRQIMPRLQDVGGSSAVWFADRGSVHGRSKVN